MNFRQFTQTFSKKYPISVQQIRLREKNFALQQLYIREKKWRLSNVSRGRRIFPEITKHHGYQTTISNMIYEPSYISLERALRYYNLIPEWVFMVTACTTKKTQQFETSIGKFIYRSLAPYLIWWYEVITIGEYNIRIAMPEKAICDYIYFHPEISGIDDFAEMRFNTIVRQEIGSDEKLIAFSKQYPKTTQRNIQYFLDYIYT